MLRSHSPCAQWGAFLFTLSPPRSLFLNWLYLDVHLFCLAYFTIADEIGRKRSVWLGMFLWYFFSSPCLPFNLHSRSNSCFKILPFQDLIGTGHSFLFLRRNLSYICSFLYNFIVFTSDRDLHQLFCNLFFKRVGPNFPLKLQREQIVGIRKGAYIINSVANLVTDYIFIYMYWSPFLGVGFLPPEHLILMTVRESQLYKYWSVLIVLPIYLLLLQHLVIISFQQGIS